MTGGPLRLATAAMGTRFELVLRAGDGDLRAAGEAALEEIETWHRRLSRFAPDSLVSHINREAARAPVSLDRDTFELLQDAVRVWRESNGAFDVTVAPVMTRWGYGDSAVSARDGRVDSGALQLDPERWRIAFARPDLSIDLGGIGKGHALDCAARVLREAGVTSALLHGGTSSIAAIGPPEPGEEWRIAVGAPDGRIVTLRDAAMSVSDAAGPGGDGQARTHIMNPPTRSPVARRVRAAVIARSARLADAWSTALVVLGRVPRSFPPEFSAFVDAYEPAYT